MEEILKDVPRYVMPNPRNYTNMELEKKAKQIKVLHKDYPNVPEYWLDMLYDYLITKDDDTLEKMINTEIHSRPPKNPRNPVPAEIGIEIEKYREDEETEKYKVLNSSRELSFLQ